MDPVMQALFRRLIAKGVTPQTLSTYIRDVMCIYIADRDLDQREINRRMQTLGWSEFDLDDHTLQQIVAVIEMHGLNNLKGTLRPTV